MADVETCEKNAATESLQHYFGILVAAIQDPMLAASELYSMELVSWPVVEKMPTLGLSNRDKNFQLLCAVHSQLAINPSGIKRFIQVLNAKLNLQEIAKKMEEKYRGELDQPGMGFI
jgi:Zn-dependent M32 family carboxypeptidase